VQRAGGSFRLRVTAGLPSHSPDRDAYDGERISVPRSL
jgi:hypothetical protein